MQSADEEWEDEEWEDEDDSSFFSGVSVASRMKAGGIAAIVVLLLLCSMIFTNFGFYSGAGSLSVLIDVNEGKDPGDRIFNANVLATSPTFGMLANEGEYSILFGGSTQVSGKFDVNDEGRGSFEVDYENFFVSNGEYTLKTKLGSQESTDRVTLNRMADSLSAEVVSFDGVTEDTEAVYPIDKDSTINLNMQFTASDSTINFINPWVTGTAKVYHYEQPFNEDQGKNYWDDDSEHGGSAESGTLVDTITFDIDSSGGTYRYSSGENVNFDEIQVGQVSLSLRLDPSQFYGEEGSGDYTVVFDFTNDFGSDTSSFDGRTYWAWFHVCETGSNGKCSGNA
tara:strand:- start:703 stop:1719 length:1017 start_codon:yes stop_codon:yes gene_type:complete